MSKLALSDSDFNKYFGFLRKLDDKTKKKLIHQLTKSLESDIENSDEIQSFYGGWEDTRNSDEIIAEIREARVNLILRNL